MPSFCFLIPDFLYMLILGFFLCHFAVKTVNTGLLLGISSKEDLQMFGLHYFVIILHIFFNSTVNKVFKTSQTWLINSSCSNLQSFITDISYISPAVKGLLHTWLCRGSSNIARWEQMSPRKYKGLHPPWGAATWNHSHSPVTSIRCTLNPTPYRLSSAYYLIQLDQCQLGTFIQIV